MARATLAVCCACGPFALAAQETQGVSAEWLVQRERMLEILMAETQQLSPPQNALVGAAEEGRSQPAEHSLLLSALYGVAPHYTVVLEVNGERQTYRPGARLPLEVQDRNRAWQLLRVQVPCVVVRRSDLPARTVCHSASEASAQGLSGQGDLLRQVLPGLGR